MCCRATSRGGCRAFNMQTTLINETRAEVAALLFPDMGNCCPVSPLCVCIPLRLREIIVHRQDWFLEKDKTLQLMRTKEKSTLLGTPSSVFYPAAQREEVVGGCS